MSVLEELTAADVAAAALDDPLLAHVHTRWAPDLVALRFGGAVAIGLRLWDGEVDAMVTGPDADAAKLVVMAVDAFRGYGGLSVPRRSVPLLPTAFALEQTAEWAFRWTDRTPPGTPPDAAGAWLPEAANPEVDAFLERAFPKASKRAGNPNVRRWAGLRDASGELVACAADATSHDSIGFLASIAADPERRGTGLGRAMSAWATEMLRREHGRVGLWHEGINVVADRLYTALGYRDDHQMAVLEPVGRARVLV